MIGVVIIKDGKIIEKNALFGDDEKNFLAMVEKQKENPDLEYVLYNDSEKEVFEAIKMEDEKDPNQASWDAIKNSASTAEKLFARMLKLNV